MSITTKALRALLVGAFLATPALAVAPAGPAPMTEAFPRPPGLGETGTSGSRPPSAAKRLISLICNGSS